MNKLMIIVVSLLFVGLFGCKEEYWPVLIKYEDLLVVDGTITNQAGPYTIRLSTSSLVQDAGYIPFSGAQVIIADNNGTQEILTETTPGEYQTSKTGIQGEVGKYYKLLIFTPDEKVYESSFSKLNEAVGIESVYASLESQPTSDPEFNYWGYQFYVTTEKASSDSINFLWRLHGTYEYHSDFLIRYYFDGVVNLFPHTDSLRKCWKEDHVNSNFTAQLSNLSEPVIHDYPLIYINTETKRISVRYSLEVSQYSVDDRAYAYFSQIQSISSEQGTLYAAQPYQIMGNLQNINDEDEPVLGYFVVGGLTKKRVFVNRPPANIQFYYLTCELSRRDYEAVGDIYMMDPNYYPIYITTDSDDRWALPVQGCMDCREDGGVVSKPDFWID